MDRPGFDLLGSLGRRRGFRVVRPPDGRHPDQGRRRQSGQRDHRQGRQDSGHELSTHLGPRHRRDRAGDAGPPVVPAAVLAIEAASCGGTAAAAGRADSPAPVPIRATADVSPAPFEAAPEPLSAPRQPALDRPDRAAEQPGGLLVGVSLQVAEHDRGAERLGQPVELLVELGPGLRGGRGRRLLGLDPGQPPPLQLATPRGLAAGPQRDPAGHAIEPARHRIPPPDRPADRARTRKAAWHASSASCRSPSTARQTPSTIGPCRSTIAANAASDSVRVGGPRPRANRSRSWPSVSPARRPDAEQRPQRLTHTAGAAAA